MNDLKTTGLLLHLSGANEVKFYLHTVTMDLSGLYYSCISVTYVFVISFLSIEGVDSWIILDMGQPMGGDVT